jgi:hypothetical protein
MMKASAMKKRKKGKKDKWLIINGSTTRIKYK